MIYIFKQVCAEEKKTHHSLLYKILPVIIRYQSMTEQQTRIQLDQSLLPGQGEVPVVSLRLQTIQFKGSVHAS